MHPDAFLSLKIVQQLFSFEMTIITIIKTPPLFNLDIRSLNFFYRIVKIAFNLSKDIFDGAGFFILKYLQPTFNKNNLI